MIRVKLFLCAVWVAASLAGCGSDGKGPGNPDAYQGNDAGSGVDGSACSQQFVDDWNGIGNSLKLVQNVAQAQDVKAKAQAFKTRYAGVHCIAVDPATNQKTTVDAEAKADSLINALDKAIAAAHPAAYFLDSAADSQALQIL